MCLQHIRKYLDEILKLVYDYWHPLMLPLLPRAGHASLQVNANAGNTSPVSARVLEFLSVVSRHTELLCICFLLIHSTLLVQLC